MKLKENFEKLLDIIFGRKVQPDYWEITVKPNDSKVGDNDFEDIDI